MALTRPPLTRPGTLAEALQRATEWSTIDDDAFRTAMAEFLDSFYLDPVKSSRKTRVGKDPGLTGLPRADAFIGGVGEHLCRRWTLGDPPYWTEAAERFLDRPFFMGPERMKPFLLIESPSAFRRRMIFTEAEPLPRSGLKPEPGEVVEAR